MSDDDKDQKHYRWDEGLPTGPDVEVLMRTWPEPKIGDRFDYATIAKLIGVTRDNRRFWTITNRWRNEMKKKGVVIYCQQTLAFYVASADQIIANTRPAFKSVGRIMRDQRTALHTIKEATDEQRKIRDHQCLLLGNVDRESRKSQLNILPSSKISGTPQIPPPKSNPNNR
jgi:hypothetical protein